MTVGTTLSIARLDFFWCAGGANKPQHQDVGGDDFTGRRVSSNITQRMTESTRIFFFILYLVTEKPAALLVTKHAEGARGTCGSGQTAVEELESKYLKDHQRDDTCHTGGTRDYEHDAGTRP